MQALDNRHQGSDVSVLHPAAKSRNEYRKSFGQIPHRRRQVGVSVSHISSPAGLDNRRIAEGESIGSGALPGSEAA